MIGVTSICAVEIKLTRYGPSVAPVYRLLKPSLEPEPWKMPASGQTEFQLRHDLPDNTVAMHPLLDAVPYRLPFASINTLPYGTPPWLPPGKS